jgi:hypothetical protein
MLRSLSRITSNPISCLTPLNGKERVHLILVQTIVNLLIIIMGTVLVLFTLLLLALHVMNAFKSKRIHEMREQLICLISAKQPQAGSRTSYMI